MSELTTIAKGKHVHLVARGTWEYAHRPGTTGIVAIAAMTNDSEMILVEQYRPPLQSRIIEMPAGLAGDLADASDESMADAARRELLEETGFVAGEMTQVAFGPISAGLSDEVITLFVARNLTRQTEGGGDHTEDIVTHLVPIDSIDHWLEDQQKEGKMVDLKVFAGLRFLTK